jgi:hypothetical protein
LCTKSQQKGTTGRDSSKSKPQTKPKRDSISRMQERPKVIGLAEEAKVEAFEASKYSKSRKKGAKAQEEEHKCRWIEQREDLDRWNPRLNNEKGAQEEHIFAIRSKSVWTNNCWI